MKNITFILLLLIGLLLQSCDSSSNSNISTDVVKNSKSATNVKGDGSVPKMEFEETVHDFGTMIQGEKVLYSFYFTNVGGSDLVITRVGTSCGCTIGKYPEKPIAPGGTDAIEVSFDSYKRKGYQNKSITVLANTEPNATTLRIKAKIVLPEQN